MISAVSKNGAASSLRRISSTAEMEKLAATSTWPAPSADAAASNAARSSSVSPVVPTTAWIPAATSAGTDSRAAAGDGEVDDDVAAGVLEGVASPSDRQPFDGLADRAGIDGRDEFELAVRGHRSHKPSGPCDPRRR